MIGKKKPETAMVVSLTAGTLAVKGTRYTFGRGDRLHRDHPLVKAHPDMFAPDGLTTAEYDEAGHAYRVKHRGIKV